VTRRNGSRAEAGRWEEGNEDFLGDGTPEPGAAHPRGGAASAARPRQFADSDPPTGERGVTPGIVYFVIDGTARLGPYSGLGSAEFIQCARPGSQIVSALAEELPPPPPPEPPPAPPPTLLEQVVSSLWGDPDSLSPEDRDAHLRSAYEAQFSSFARKLMAPLHRHRGIGAIEGVEGRADRDAERALMPVIDEWRRGATCRELRRARGLIAEVAGDLHAAEGRLRQAEKRVQAARAAGQPNRPQRRRGVRRRYRCSSPGWSGEKPCSTRMTIWSARPTPRRDGTRPGRTCNELPAARAVGPAPSGWDKGRGRFLISRRRRWGALDSSHV
jgi:hypothetical protein